VALSRDFAKSGILYLAYSEPRDVWTNGTAVLRARLALTANGGKLEDAKVIFRQLPAISSSHHFGARIVVNPDDSLFVTLGDRYSERDQAQIPANHLGKIVRIQQDGAPFEGNPKRPGWAPEVWSIGHRNVQGAAVELQRGEDRHRHAEGWSGAAGLLLEPVHRDQRSRVLHGSLRALAQ
jgi:aldose sugar dehydrogenase